MDSRPGPPRFDDLPLFLRSPDHLNSWSQRSRFGSTPRDCSHGSSLLSDSSTAPRLSYLFLLISALHPQTQRAYALGLIFSPFTSRTLVFVAISVAVFVALPFLTPWFFRRYGGRVSELEAKYLLFFLFAMGGLAVWSGSEAVLPAHTIGMVLAGTVGKDHVLVRRLRTLTFGLLTPFYIIRASSFVSVPALLGSPLVFVVLFFSPRWFLKSSDFCRQDR
jgi:Kef-type K+ transport system membrane component KefB